MGIAQIGYAVDDTRFSGEQRGGQDRQRRILRAADLDGTRKRIAAVNEDLIHTWQKGTVSRRYNRSPSKCRGNFFPPGPKEAPRSVSALFPMPAFHPAEAAMAPDQSARALAHRPAHQRTKPPPDHAIPRARGCASPALRCKEDSRQSGRKLPQRFGAADSSETGRGRSSLAWRHSPVRA